jgi:hypothetical protein
MARKSTGRTGRKSSARSSAKPTRSRSNEKRPSARGSSSSSSTSHRGAESRKVVSISHGRKQSSPSGRSSGASRPAGAHVLTNHDEIRRWAEERGAHPASVRGTGDREDVGMIRLDFPGYRGEGSLGEINWDEWFRKFDEIGLALLVQEQTARGQKSNFNKLVKRETAEARAETSTGRSRGKRTA